MGIAPPGQEVAGHLGLVPALEAGCGDDVPAPEVAQPMAKTLPFPGYCVPR